MNWISRCKSQLRCHAARRWCASLLLAAFILGAISSVWMVARNSARVDRRDDIDPKECDHVADVITMLLESAHHIEHPCLHESSRIAPRINSMFEDEARLILQRKGYHIPRNWTTIFNKMLVDDRECRWEASRLSTNGISIVRDNDREAVFNSDDSACQRLPECFVASPGDRRLFSRPWLQQESEIRTAGGKTSVRGQFSTSYSVKECSANRSLTDRAIQGCWTAS